MPDSHLVILFSYKKTTALKVRRYAINFSYVG